MPTADSAHAPEGDGAADPTALDAARRRVNTANLVPDQSTRNLILSEASEMVHDSGLGGLSIRKLAGRLNLSATALYRHFENKDHLVVCIRTEGFERFAASLAQALEAKTDRDRLVRAISSVPPFRAHLAELLPRHVHEPPGAHGSPRDHQQRTNGAFRFLVDRVEACFASGVLNSGAPP